MTSALLHEVVDHDFKQGTRARTGLLSLLREYEVDGPVPHLLRSRTASGSKTCDLGYRTYASRDDAEQNDFARTPVTTGSPKSLPASGLSYVASRLSAKDAHLCSFWHVCDKGSKF